MRTKTIALAAGGALALTTLGGVAVALPVMAATSSATATEGTTDDADGKTAAERLAERTARIAEKLAGLVTDGTITQDQADAVAGTLAEAAPEGFGGPGGHGPGGRHGGPGGLGDVLHQGLATAAETLGLEEDALRDRLRDGETLGEVADAEGVDRDDLVAALVAEAEKALAQKVSDGDLTQAQADEITSGLTERITEGLDRERPAGGPGMRGGPDDAPSDSPTSTPSPSTTEGDS